MPQICPVAYYCPNGIQGLSGGGGGGGGVCVCVFWGGHQHGDIHNTFHGLICGRKNEVDDLNLFSKKNSF